MGSEMCIRDRFKISSAYGLIIASDGGPIEVKINTGDGYRVIYNRPAGDSVATYESDAFVASDLSIAVEATASVSWKLLIVTR